MNAVKIIARSAAIVIAFVASIYTGIWLAELALKLHQSLVDVIATQRVLEFVTGNPIWVIAAVAFVWLVLTQLCGLSAELAATVTFIVTLVTSLVLSWAINSLRVDGAQASEVVNFYLCIVWIAWAMGLLLVLVFWSTMKLQPQVAQEETAVAGEGQ